MTASGLLPSLTGPSRWLARYSFVIDDIEYFDEAINDAPEVIEATKENVGEAGEKKWILKPSIVDRASELCIFSTLEQLQKFLERRFEQAFHDDTVESVAHLREWSV